MADPRPFSPPNGFAFESALLGPTPRAIPERLREGPHAVRRRAAIRGWAIFGAICLALANVPGIEVLALYFVPAGYLDWIGLAALAFSGWSWCDAKLRPGPYRWIRDGVPLAVRIEELVMAPSVVVNGQTTQHAFTATIVFTHPESGLPTGAQLKSNDFPSTERNEFRAPFRVGDYVTAVYLPGKPGKSLRLYGFLDLDPACSVQRHAPDAPPRSPLAAAAATVGGVLFFAALLANVYAFERYEPLALDWHQAVIPFGAGVLLFGGAFLVSLVRTHRAEQQRLRKRNERAAAAGEAIEVNLGGGVSRWIMAIVILLGMPLLGGLSVLCWAFLANAWLDESPPRLTPVRIENLWMTTHAFLFREYTVEFALEDSRETSKLLTTPEHLMELTDERGVALLHRGRLGWPWVEAVVPAGDPGTPVARATAVESE